MEYRNISEDTAEEEMIALEIASAGQRLGAWVVDFAIWVTSIVIAVISVLFLEEFVQWRPSIELTVQLIWVGYPVVTLALIAIRGQSLGKMAVGIKIVKTDGTPVGLGTAFLREILGKLVSAIVIYIGFIWLLFDDKRQGWHDKIASTYVVKL